MAHPEISVIIRTYNEEKYLPLLLEALSNQERQNFETIIVDSGSTDNTCKIAAPRAHKLIEIKKHDFTFGYALNVGGAAASGKYLVMVSAHTKPVGRDWLERLVAPLRSESVAMSYGRQIGWETSKFGEATDFYRVFHTRKEDLKPPHFFANNANSAVRRDLWQDHPFDEELPGLEDAEFAKYWMERGYRVVYEPEAIIHHIHEESWPQVHRRYFREAVAARVMGLSGKAHIPNVVSRESYWFFKDVICQIFNPPKEVRRRAWFTELKEIARFRYLKALGTVQGILSSEEIKSQNIRQFYFFDKTGKTVIIAEPGLASVEDVEVRTPKPGEVLLRVAYAGVSSTDIEMFDGTFEYNGQHYDCYPKTPGREFSATVAAMGQNVKHLAVGEPVIAENLQQCGECAQCIDGHSNGCAKLNDIGVTSEQGAYSEYLILPGHQVHKLPDNVDLKLATLIEPLAVAIKGLSKIENIRVNKPSSSDVFGVYGAGLLGQLISLTLQHRGHKVQVIDKNPSRLKPLSPLVTTTDDPDILISCGTVIEVTGDGEVLEKIIRKTKPGCSILLIGLPYARHSFSISNVMMFDKTLVGSVGYDRSHLTEAIELISKLPLEHCLEHEFELQDFKNAWQAHRTGTALKTILRVS
ncbi:MULTISPECIES: alcohol dehydrogenase catalytic domain-containing protein [unclassified Thalassospira]|uniref:alcohol dehydrogenase catalytic domain-containing protein n=1 Tax=unclassified Thalassospira TaxID=2648997 RepID=UPI0007A62C8C|nr:MULTISPECIES: alcohol dehydrogenase catalytic domain-containing protein [unclassified Thalassospira]KZC99075.1 hypothetical protein AUQ41_11145 [Thalassospira sp. MCCC 1A02898]ONH88634.1 family 2 glycosyl transferase [Thalassospira sp. MCCC 1A02803]